MKFTLSYYRFISIYGLYIMMRTFGKILGFLTRKGFLIQMEVSYLLIIKTDKGNALSEYKIMCPRSAIMIDCRHILLSRGRHSARCQKSLDIEFSQKSF